MASHVDFGANFMPVIKTDCECLDFGFCHKMGRTMSKIRWTQCQTDPAYYNVFLRESSNPPKIVPFYPESDWNRSPCKHLGPEVDSVFCESCGGNSVNYPVRECVIYGL